MTLIELEAKRFHVGQMARLLRVDHAAVLAAAPRSIHRQLLEAFEASIIRRVWILDGKLAAMAGLVGTLGDDEGTVWLALSDDVSKDHPITVARAAAKFLRQCERTRSSLTTDILSDDKPSYHFALHLGFNTSGHSIIDGIHTVQMTHATRKAA